MLTNHARPTASSQRAALTQEARRRGFILPARFDVPDHSLWGKGYAAEAHRSLLATGRTLPDALKHVCQFLDPVLDGRAAGTWNPAARLWEP